MKMLIVGLAAVCMVACGQNEVSWDTQETQRSIAIENSEFNARQFRTKNKQYAGYNIMGRGDSTISKSCANGDGWASVDLVSPNGKKVPLKCSTASSNIGCLLKFDFEKRAYANQEGSCNRDLPVPMPKIIK